MLKSEDRGMRILANAFMIVITLFCVIPFILLVIASFTDNAVAIKEGYSFTPSGWSLSAYEYLVQQWSTIGRGYLMTIIVTVVGTVLGLIITSTFAYALSVPDLPGSRLLMLLVVISMLFNGGIVASYYIYANVIHVRDTIWGLIMPGMLMNAFNIILVRNYMQNQIAKELLESARIDGAGEIWIFIKIVVPLAVPILATIGLLAAIGYWNDWMNGLYYLTKRGGSQFFTIQLILNQMNEDITYLANNATQLGLRVDVSTLPTTTMRMAIAVVAILPILVAYPFFQKYFIKGINLGAVKG